MAQAVEERKLATVLFADLVGSTELGDSQDPERTRALLNRFYDAMAEEVEHAGGTIEKFAGDAVMAAFGAPAALEDHAERALHAALAMLRRVRELDERLQLRIGINTGEVVVGQPREGSSFVTGDPVNVAARLEQGAEPGEILVGERTVAAARGAFEFAESQTIEAKGKPGGVALPPASARAVPDASAWGQRPAARVRRPRRRAGAPARRLSRGRRRSGRPRLVTILGDAGVGKSRLVRELWDRLSDEEPEPLRRTGRCLPYGQGITYWPLAELLREHFGILEGESAERTLEVLGERRFLALTLGLDVAEGLHPLLVRDRFQDAWSEFLGDVSSERPLVVLVEDVHWADDQLLELLERLVEDVQGPLLLIATARPELLDTRPGWSSRGTAELIELEALSAEDAVRLLDELLAGELPGGPARRSSWSVPRATRSSSRSCSSTLIDRGLPRAGQRRVDDRAAAGRLRGSGLGAGGAGRADRPPRARGEGGAAGRLGDRPRLLAGARLRARARESPTCGCSRSATSSAAGPGSSMPGEREYAIKHALTREVAYESLPRARSARLHADFARWLERTAAERDELAPLLAHHYAEAVRPEDADLAWAGDEAEAAAPAGQAGRWLRRAAALAVGRYELEDAIGFYRRAIELEDDRTELARLWSALADAHGLRFDGERLVEAMETAIELADDPVLKGEMYADLALHSTGRVGMWRTYPEEGQVESWIEQGIALTPPGSTGRAKALLASSFWPGSASTGGAAEAAAIAEQQGDTDLHALALTALSFEASRAGEYEQAMTHASHSLGLADEGQGPGHRRRLVPRRGPVDGRARPVRRGRAAHRGVRKDQRAAHPAPPRARSRGRMRARGVPRRLGPDPRARAGCRRAGRRQRRDAVCPQRTLAAALRARARPRGRRRGRPPVRGAGQGAMDGRPRPRARRPAPAARARPWRPGRGRAPARHGGQAPADDLVHLVDQQRSSTGSGRSGGSSSSRRCRRVFAAEHRPRAVRGSGAGPREGRPRSCSSRPPCSSRASASTGTRSRRGS